ncbi:hypothetical protein F5148DRAFT_1155200 [Russula earlei]|uniref:Uncharacterized protein n=1 Tax=Russula earlei TaxID=71964 RepID=A0ACC0TS95_9AGAM|nr:hypothetical protein F5148DRAFT_1155200 [Russula earlei]
MRAAVAIEVVENAKAGTEGTEAVADTGGEETSECTVVDETKAGVADEAEVAATGGANGMVAAAGDAGNMMVDKTGMTMEGGGTVGKAGRAGAWADAAMDSTGCETAVDETGEMATGRAGGAKVMATEGVGNMEVMISNAGCARMAGMMDKSGEGEMIGGIERHGCVGAGAGDAGKEGQGSPEWRGEMGDRAGGDSNCTGCKG